MSLEKGKLILIPTPIGNLEDITLRALRILKEVNIVLCEDTRTSSVLLKHYQITTPLHSYHAHNEHKMLDKWIKKIEEGETIGLISDAGTPSISDPGFLLTRECLKNNIEVECLPGATAFVPALVKSGLPSDQFVFEGFLPVKKGRQTAFKALALERRTIILYESPYRICKTLEELIIYLSENRQISISRELSKKFEETFNGTIQEALVHFKAKEPRGEFVIIIGAKSE